MARDNALYQLVSSLDRTEKRYVKVNAGISKTNRNLLRLFNAVDKQAGKGYDEAAIRKEFEGESFLKQLSVAQNRLSALILRHLRNYHASNSVDIHLSDLIAEIQILHKKRLFDLCQKQIAKAKKLAAKHERRLPMLELLKWETILQKEEGRYLHKSQDRLEALYNEEKQLLLQHKRGLEYKFHNLNLLLLSRNKMVSQVNEELASYHDLLQTKPYQFEFGSLPLQDEIYALRMKAMYYFSKFEYKKSMDNFGLVVERLEQEPDRLEDFKQEYFMGLNNFLVGQTWAQDRANFMTTVDKIYKHFGGIPAFEREIFAITNLYEMAIYIELGELDRCKEILPAVESGLKKYKGQTNPINEQIYYFNIALTYFFDQNYSSTIRWLNRLVNQSNVNRSEISSNIHYYAQLFNLVVHYEAENFELLEYLIGSTRKWLQSIREFNQFDLKIITFFKEVLLEEYDKAKLRSQFSKLAQELQVLAEDPAERIALDYFRFITWAKSKSSGRPILQLVQEGGSE